MNIVRNYVYLNNLLSISSRVNHSPKLLILSRYKGLISIDNLINYSVFKSDLLLFSFYELYKVSLYTLLFINSIIFYILIVNLNICT
jgi:hypothetical protein